MNKSILLAACVAGLIAGAAPALAATYRVADKFAIGGDGKWDYPSIDSTAQRLYLSRATHVVIVDTQTGRIAGDVPDTPGVHGIALAPGAGSRLCQRRKIRSGEGLRPEDARRDRHDSDRIEARCHRVRADDEAGIRLQRPQQQRHRHRRVEQQGGCHHSPSGSARGRPRGWRGEGVREYGEH